MANAFRIEVGLLSLTVVEMMVAYIETESLERLYLKTEGEEGWSVFTHTGAIDKLVYYGEESCLVNCGTVGHVHLGAELILEGHIYEAHLYISTDDRTYAKTILVTLQIYTIIILSQLTRLL